MLDYLMQYAVSDRQREVLNAVIKEGHSQYNPTHGHRRAQLKPFWNAKAAAEYLTYLRSK